jgi:hypothetical protein
MPQLINAPSNIVPRPGPQALLVAPLSAPDETLERVERWGRELYTAPFCFDVRVVVNGAARRVPLVFEEGAPLLDITRALALVAGAGGFDARVARVRTTEAQLWLGASRRSPEGARRIRACTSELLSLATDALPLRFRHEPLAIELHATPRGALSLHLSLEAPHSAALDEALRIAARVVALELAPAGLSPSVGVSYRQTERIVVRTRLDVESLLCDALDAARADGALLHDPSAVTQALQALGAAAHDAGLARAHNALIESAIAAVALALGNAPERVVADAETYAARHAGCEPLCRWRLLGDALHGELQLPLDIETHGRWRAPGAELTPRDSATHDIAQLAACVGMAASVLAVEDAIATRAPAARLDPLGS